MNIPEGWKLVPVEPTEEMRQAGMGYLRSLTEYSIDVYHKMLDAAPIPPAQSHDKATADYNEPAMDSSWKHLKTRLDSKEWTTGEACNYRGFFAWGWEARRQYDTPPVPEVEPVAWIRGSGLEMLRQRQPATVFASEGCSNYSAPLYTHPANDGLRKAIKSITDLLRNREWAEHVSSDPDVADLEAQITAMHGELGRMRKAAEIVIESFKGTTEMMWSGALINLRAELNKDKSC